MALGNIVTCQIHFYLYPLGTINNWSKFTIDSSLRLAIGEQYLLNIKQNRELFDPLQPKNTYFFNLSELVLVTDIVIVGLIPIPTIKPIVFKRFKCGLT